MKYKVSLALKIPANFETEVKAASKKEAFEKALSEYCDGYFEDSCIRDVDFGVVELDINKKQGIDSVGNGIFIQAV